MKITNDSVVTIDYTLTDDSGKTLDSSKGKEPLVYLHGHGNIIFGLENALNGKQIGDAMKVTVAPDEAYGERNEDFIQTAPREMFKGVDEIQVGMQFQARSPMGMQLVTITAVNGDEVTLDANHPLAGMTLTFDVAIVGVRAATKEELEHGHVHGAGGHNH